MENAILYIGLVVGILGLSLLVGWLKRKFGIGDKQEKFLQSILEVAIFIAQEFEIDKTNADLIELAEILITALKKVNHISKTMDLVEKKELIMQTALEICRERDLDLGDGLVIKVVDRVSDYLIGLEIIK